MFRLKFELLYVRFIESLDAVAPVKKIIIKHTNKGWFDSYLRKAIHKKIYEK